MNIGIIGAGAIANFLLEQQSSVYQVKSILVRNYEKYESLAAKHNMELYTDVQAFLASGIDVVVEAADIAAVQQLLPIILREKPVVLISIGALADEVFSANIVGIAEQSQHTLYLPSGAIGGLDLLQNAQALGAVNEVKLRTRKPATSLLSEPVEAPTTIFEGSAAEAIQRFPKNMNVSIVLALAGLGFQKTKVTLVADPTISVNMHEIEIFGDFGEVMLTVKNNPLPANPKTSYLAAMSIVGTLQRMQGQLVIGR